MRRLVPCAQLEPSSATERRSANYYPTIWQDKFIQSVNVRDQHEDKNRENIYKLKREVSQMLYKEELLREKLELVDAIQQLGVAYHFKDEINSIIDESMDQISSVMLRGDLYETSLLFRLLRNHGFSVHEDIFKSFFDDKGRCKPELASDIKGMLNLYEASYHAKEGEELLETARNFTTKHLTEFLESSNMKYNDSSLKKHVAHALDLPLHWRMERLHTRWFIDHYKTDEHVRPALWELAVLDFNVVQQVYQKELKHVSRWWTDLELYNKLPFIRDRLVENFLWTVGCSYIPDHSTYRIALTQANSMITTIDDVYDVYGSLDELEIFTDAIEQWDISAAEGLPENLRICILALFNTVKDQGDKVLRENGNIITPCLRRAWKDLCKSYLVEARWYHNGYAPTLEEFLDNAWISIGGNLLLSYAYCINNYVTAEDLEKFSSGYPDIVRYSLMHLRLYNDLATSSDELQRGDIDKSIQCYMRDKNVTESVARQGIKELIWKYWRALNGEVTGNSDFEKYFRTVAFNLSRTSHLIYGHDDGYGKPDGDTKDVITSLFFTPIN